MEAVLSRTKKFVTWSGNFLFQKLWYLKKTLIKLTCRGKRKKFGGKLSDKFLNFGGKTFGQTFLRGKTFGQVFLTIFLPAFKTKGK